MYAILGATGKVGGAAVRDLRHRGLSVRAIVRDARKTAHLAQSGCEIMVANVHDADGLKVALAGASEVLVICPMNPQAEDAPAEHASMIEAIGSALEHIKPRSIVAISDYGAHTVQEPALRLHFTGLSKGCGRFPFPAHFSVPQSTCKTGAGSFQVPLKPVCSQSSIVPRPSSFRLFQLTMLAWLLPIYLPARIGRAKGCRSSMWKVLKGTQFDEVRETIGTVVGRRIDGRELPPERWVSALMQGGLSESYAQLVAGMYAAHNAGRIDVESEFSDVRRGSTSLADVLASLSREHE